MYLGEVVEFGNTNTIHQPVEETDGRFSYHRRYCQAAETTHHGTGTHPHISAIQYRTRGNLPPAREQMGGSPSSRSSINALVVRDAALGDTWIGDDTVNQLEVTIDEECNYRSSPGRPAAGDLRSWSRPSRPSPTSSASVTRPRKIARMGGGRRLAGEERPKNNPTPRSRYWGCTYARWCTIHWMRSRA